MKIRKLYLDMDGVLCDFNKRFTELFGSDALTKRDKKMWTKDWPDFIERKSFENLDWHTGGSLLLLYISQYPKLEVEILSSSGGERFHEEVERQKLVWLKKQGITYKANIVPGRKHKKDYAEPDVILIDDTYDVIEAFNKAGGIGILHRNIEETLERLHFLLGGEKD